MEQEFKNRKFMQNTSIRSRCGAFHEERHGMRACGLNYVRGVKFLVRKWKFQLKMTTQSTRIWL